MLKDVPDNSKKVQKSIHFREEIFQLIAQRALINQRTISGEVEFIIRKQLEAEDISNRQALAMASSAK